MDALQLERPGGRSAELTLPRSGPDQLAPRPVPGSALAAPPVSPYTAIFGAQDHVKNPSDPSLVALARQTLARTPELVDTPFGRAATAGRVEAPAVRDLQQFLLAKGHSVGQPGVDGKFGPLTHQALRDFLSGSAKGPEAPDGGAAEPLGGTVRKRRLRVASGGIPVAYRQGKPMHAAIAPAWDRMAAAAARDGVNLRINSGYRSIAEQARLFRAAVRKYGSVARARKWVAPPGRSTHQRGNALDVSRAGGAHAWLRRNASKFGFYQPYSWEPWHWERRL